jgi:DNA-binding NarL/FixJ family response regulator
MEAPIRIVLADDHPIFRDALQQLLSLQKDFEVVAEIGDGAEVMRFVEEHRPDILLLDLKLPGAHGFTILKKMQADNNTVTKVILLTASEDTGEYLQAIQLGTSGIVLKQSPTNVLFKKIREVYAEKIQRHPQATKALIHEFSAVEDHAPRGQDGRERPPLSERERQIVALVAQGYRNKEMAEKMLLSEQTVKNHMHNIFEKLGVSDRLDLALYAIHKKLCA